MKQDSMVIEYRGERLRRTVADARERRYRAAGKDCYLFNVNDDTVVDATMKGTKGRFTVRALASALVLAVPFSMALITYQACVGSRVMVASAAAPVPGCCATSVTCCT